MPDSNTQVDSQEILIIPNSPEVQLEAFRGIIAARQFGLKSAMILNAGGIGVFFTFVAHMKLRLDAFTVAGFFALLVGAAIALLESSELSDDLLLFMTATDQKRYDILKRGERKYRLCILVSYFGFAVGGLLASMSAFSLLLK